MSRTDLLQQQVEELEKIVLLKDRRIAELEKLVALLTPQFQYVPGVGEIQQLPRIMCPSQWTIQQQPECQHEPDGPAVEVGDVPKPAFCKKCGQPIPFLTHTITSSSPAK